MDSTEATPTMEDKKTFLVYLRKTASSFVSFVPEWKNGVKPEEEKRGQKKSEKSNQLRKMKKMVTNKIKEEKREMVKKET